MKHLLIRDNTLNGWEYGMLRSFEEAIIKKTGAAVASIPDYKFAPTLIKHFGQGMNRDHYRKYFPKQSFPLEADCAWYILMGPENYRLDLYRDWNKNIKQKVLYLYDTMPFQYPLIKKLVSSGDWDILITSLNDSAVDLKKLTGREWHVVEQAADLALFKPVPMEERTIHFSSYGRRHPQMHEAVKAFCEEKGLYYDYTSHDARHPVVDATELYRQYAWHLNHSLFTISWPVELTNPQRAGHLHPITCRWFEAAAAGTHIIGKSPDNAYFNQLFGQHFVHTIDPSGSAGAIRGQLADLWERRQHIFTNNKSPQLGGWEERVDRIISLL